MRGFPGRPGLTYALLLALAVALFYWKTLLTRQFTFIIGSEPVNMTYSWLNFWVRSVRALQFPLWDPYAFAGRPFAAEMLPSAFYPLHLVLAVLPFNRDGLFSPQLYNVTFIATHLLGAYFTFALIREFRLARLAAFVGACCFALGGVMVKLLWLPYVESGIWLPAAFLFLVRALRAERSREAVLDASLCGACLGLSILAGGIYMSMMQGIVVITALAYHATDSRLPWTAHLSAGSHWMRVSCIALVIFGVAAGVGAVQLLPSQEFSHLTLRFIDGGTIASSEKIPYDRLNPGMWPQSIITVLFPSGFDGKIGGGEISIPYIGVFPFFLAVVAIFKCRGQVWVRYLAGLALLAFVYSLSEFSPLHGVLYALVPYLWMARAASRFLYLTTFALAMLAAFGFDYLLNSFDPASRWDPANRILKWVAIGCGVVLLVSGCFNLDLSIWNSYSLLLILASCAWFAYLTRNGATRRVQFLLIAFILFDLNAFNWLEANKSDLRKNGDQLDQMISLRGPATFLKSRHELYRVRVQVNPEPNIGDTYGVPSLWGGGSGVMTSLSRLMAFDTEGLLNVRYWIRPAAAVGASPIYQDAHWKIYENPRAFPRAWVVHQVVLEPSQEATFRRLGDGTLDLRRMAVVQEPIARLLGQNPPVPEMVRFRSYEANRMSMDVTTESGGLLVLSEIAYPGWRATVNGRPAVIHTADGALRSVMLNSGANRISLSYVPFSFYFGGAVTMLSFLWVLAALVWRLRS